MVIERFKEVTAPEIYRRFRERGRMLREGLEYISSWFDLGFKICWQLIQTEDYALFDNGRRTGGIYPILKLSRYALRPDAAELIRSEL